jgi:uncharacterized protein HemX
VTTGALVVIAVLVILFMVVVAALAWAGAKVFVQLQTGFFSELRQMNAEQSAERQASQDAYAQFLDQQAANEQVLEQADREWTSKPESQVAYDDDLQWEEQPNG